MWERFIFTPNISMHSGSLIKLSIYIFFS
jgi:hypothetical protein